MKIDNKKDEILRVASKMFFEKGFDKTSMRDLAEATRLTTAGLYYYIKSKKNLLMEVDEFLIHEFEKKVFPTSPWETDPRKRIRHFIGNVVHLVLESPELHTIMTEKAFLRGEIKRVSRPRRKELVRRTEAFLIQLGKEVEASQDIKEEIDITVAAFSLIAIINWLPLWFNPKGRISKEQLIDSLSNFFIKFFFKEKKGDPTPRG